MRFLFDPPLSKDTESLQSPLFTQSVLESSFSIFDSTSLAELEGMLVSYSTLLSNLYLFGRSTWPKTQNQLALSRQYRTK